MGKLKNGKVAGSIDIGELLTQLCVLDDMLSHIEWCDLLDVTPNWTDKRIKKAKKELIALAEDCRTIVGKYITKEMKRAVWVSLYGEPEKGESSNGI
ncbi:MAG: hypothetical protein ABSA71_15430 [Desulfomonilia bacterium]|jgi:hypothetical protein